MKKISLLIILIVTLFLTGCGSSNLESLSLEELNTKIEAKETFIVFFGSKKNTDLEKKLETVLEKNNLKGFRVNTDKLSDSEEYLLQKTIPYEDPSIVFILEGKDPSKLSHVTDENILVKHLEERLKDLSFIK